MSDTTSDRETGETVQWVREHPDGSVEVRELPLGVHPDEPNAETESHGPAWL